MALFHLDVELRLAGQLRIFRLHGAERAERAHLGHAPGMHHLDAVDVLEGLGDGARAGRAADHHALEVRQLAAGLLEVLQQHQPHRRHRGGETHFVGVEQFVDRGAVHLGARHHQRGADHRRREGERPAIGVEHRHHRHHHVARGDALGIRQRRDDRRAARWSGANRARPSGARWCRRCSTCRTRCSRRTRPGEIAVDFGDPVLVGDRVLQRRRRHMRGVGEHDVALDGGQLVGDLFQQRHEGEIDDHHAVFGMIDDPHDLLGEQPRIDRVVDRADADDAVPGFQMPCGVPGQRRHPVAELDAVFRQPLRHFQRARADRCVVGLDDRAFDRSGDDLALAVKLGGMVDDAMKQQRPILHEPEHGIPLLDVLVFWAGAPRQPIFLCAHDLIRKPAPHRVGHAFRDHALG